MIFTLGFLPLTSLFFRLERMTVLGPAFTWRWEGVGGRNDLSSEMERDLNLAWCGLGRAVNMHSTEIVDYL